MGGGNLGALQVGMLRALTERDIRPDLVLGCSVGALNGAAYAADPTIAGVDRLEALWLRLDGADVMPAGRGCPRRCSWPCGARRSTATRGCGRSSTGSCAPPGFDELRIPVPVRRHPVEPVAERLVRPGALHAAILASAALPAVFPVVEIDGVHRYFDGAVVNDVPVTRAVDVGARTAYVLHVGNLDRPWIEPKRPIDVAIQAYWLARRLRYDEDRSLLPAHVDLNMLPFGDPTPPRYDDFSHTEELINQAYAATAAHLDAVAGDESQDAPTMPLEVRPDDVPRVQP